MAVTFLHTADWQLGKPFGFIEGDTAAVLREQRFATVKRIAALAREREVDAVLVAGDVFDSATAPDRDIRRAVEAMKPYNGPWVLLPGNHDPALSESPWTRLLHIGCPDNVLLALTPEPILLAGGRLAVLPAPLCRRHEPDDVTQWMDAAETPAETIRVGLAHGSIPITEREGDAKNEIAANRAETANLDYLALGDWHGTTEITPKTWYSGTPEPDRFPRNDPGNVLVVTVNGPGAAPNVEKIRTGHFQWRRHEVTCGVGGDENPAEAVEAELKASAERSDVTLLDLLISGTTDFAGRRNIEDCLEVWESQFRYLRRDLTDLIDEPTAEDLDSIDKSGFVRNAVDRLKAIADNQADPNCQIARTALRMLYFEHVRAEQ